MQTYSFIFKNRYTTYYFRQRTPNDILNHLPSAKNEVKFSLKTKDKSVALVLARQHKTKFDGLFKELRDIATMRNIVKERFEDKPVEEQQYLMLQQRTIEAIQDQQYTQQLFFLFERKDRIKNAFNNIEALNGHSLADFDLSSIEKINHFIAIIDLLSNTNLSDPSPYLKQLVWKTKSVPTYSVSTSNIYKSITISKCVIKRNKKTKKAANTVSNIKRQSNAVRKSVGHTMIQLIDGEIGSGQTPAVRTQADDIHPKEDVVLENIILDNEQDVINFAKLFSLIEQGDDVTMSDFEKIAKPVIVPKTMLKLSELFEKFCKERKSEWTDVKFYNMNVSVFNLFIEINGDLFADQLDYEHANKFIDIAQKLPANRNKLTQFKTKSIDEILALEGTFEPMKKQNVNKYIRLISSAFTLFKQRKYIKDNFIDGMKIKNSNPKAKTSDERDRFEDNHLSAIFECNQYKKSTHKRTYQHWLPLLGLYTGARIQELSQLRLSDIYKEDGIWVIDINEVTDENDNLHKSVKTANSIRLVPIHKTLISLGFIKYITHLIECYESGVLNSILVFPDLAVGRDGYGHNSAKWFARFLVQLKIKEDGISFHSFRHTFTDELSQALENSDIISQLLGHKPKGETRKRYAKPYKVSTVKKVVDSYMPMSDKQIKKIKPFLFWKEFTPQNSLKAFKGVSATKSIFKDKNLVKCLNKIMHVIKD